MTTNTLQPTSWLAKRLNLSINTIERLRAQPTWDKPELVELFNFMIPEFQHKETGKYLDGRM